MSLQFLLSRRWVSVILIGVVITVGTSLGRALYQRTQLQRQISDLQQSITAQEQEKVEYQQLLDKIHDFTYIEREARLTFGLKKPGEGVFVVPDTVLNVKNAPTATAQVTGNPERWWKYFFGEEVPRSKEQDG